MRGELEALISRIVQGEAAAAQAAIFDTRPPVVEKVQPPVAAPPPEPARDPALVLLENVQARMAARLTYPEAARARGTTGPARVGHKVSAKGELLEARVSSSSGSAVLDRAALTLARSAFPAENPAQAEVELSIEVTFKLE